MSFASAIALTASNDTLDLVDQHYLTSITDNDDPTILEFVDDACVTITQMGARGIETVVLSGPMVAEVITILTKRAASELTP